MANLPRPLLALLVAVLALFAAWMVVLRPHASTGAASSGQVAKAYHSAVSPSHAPASHARSATVATGTAAAKAPARDAGKAATAAKDKATATPATRLAEVTAALRADKVLAVLVYNPAGSADMADVQTLSAIPSDGAKVVKVAVPVNEVARYSAILGQLEVQSTPTLVVVDGHHRAQTLTGFADGLAYDELVDSALAASAK